MHKWLAIWGLSSTSNLDGCAIPRNALRFYLTQPPNADIFEKLCARLCAMLHLLYSSPFQALSVYYWFVGYIRSWFRYRYPPGCPPNVLSSNCVTYFSTPYLNFCELRLQHYDCRLWPASNLHQSCGLSEALQLMSPISWTKTLTQLMLSTWI